MMVFFGNLPSTPSPYPLPPGERVNILKYKKKFPPPRWGRDRVGVKMGFFHTFGEAGPAPRGVQDKSPEPHMVQGWECRFSIVIKVKVNTKDQEFPPGTKFIRVVNQIREANKDNPVLKSLIEKTGKDHITFVYNRRVVKPPEYESIELKEGDEIRWMLPYAGG